MISVQSATGVYCIDRKTNVAPRLLWNVYGHGPRQVMRHGFVTTPCPLHILLQSSTRVCLKLLFELDLNFSFEVHSEHFH